MKNTKIYSYILRFSMVLFFLCLFMVFYVDKGSAEFVIMVISTVINAVLAIVSGIILNIKEKRKD
jgi:hypothetical protein